MVQKTLEACTCLHESIVIPPTLPGVCARSFDVYLPHVGWFACPVWSIELFEDSHLSHI